MLTTERLLLRPARAGDLDDMFSYMSDARAMAYWSTPPHPDKAVTKAQLDRMVAYPGPYYYLMFEYQSRVIGMGGLHSGNEVGFMLHPDFWRQGFVTEAMGAILPHIWRTTDHAFVFADADPRNDASCGLLLSLGFHETHRAKNTFCVDGVWSDSVYYRLDRPAEFATNSAPKFS